MAFQITDQPKPQSTTQKVYSAPVYKEDKEFLLNESIRTGLSQKEIIGRAIKELQKGSRIPQALPIKL